MNRQPVPGGVVHQLPADLRRSLMADATTLAAWKDITPLARNEFICWIEDAKQEATRQRRIRRTREELEAGSPGTVHSTARRCALGGHCRPRRLTRGLRP